MAMNRVQFQPGLSMHQFMELYGTVEKCEAAVIGWRWPHGYVCPSCSQADVGFSSFRRGRLPYRQCSACHFQSPCFRIVAASIDQPRGRR